MKYIICIVILHVHFMKPLDDKQLKELKSTLNRFLGKNETLNLTLKVSISYKMNLVTLIL